MKRSFIAGILLLSVISVSAVGYVFLKNTTEEIILLSDRALKYAEENNFREMVSAAEEIKRIWVKKESILSAITPHGETESMDEIIEKMIFFGENKDTDKYTECCIELKAKAYSVKEEEKISWRNIF